MNFYEHQDRARRKTAVLFVYFALAVALMAAAINVVVFFAFSQSQTGALGLSAWLARPYWLLTTLAVVAVIGLGTLHTSFRLRGGGVAVADWIGARRVEPATADAAERQLINVVEEMSIASGTPVPALYVLDDEVGINAFVAGTRPTETVLVVTRGALAAFTRDELQGVVGHEYSHIFHQDMRINMRLMGILAGILLINRLGHLVLRAGGRRRNRGSSHAALLGFGLLVLGYLGVLLGSLIQAAISRQREFLADASSVQFTRNPDGIAGALTCILEHGGGSRLSNAHASDLAHFCFGESVRPAFAGLLATHPPLVDRIKAINPGFVRSRRPQHTVEPAAASAATPVPTGVVELVPSMVAAAVGTLHPRQAVFAQALHAEFPPALLTAAHGPHAERVIYALILTATTSTARAQACALLARVEGADCVAHVSALLPEVEKMPALARLPLVNVSLPALKALAASNRARIVTTVRDLVRVDRKLTVFEFALSQILADHLADDAPRQRAIRHFKFSAVADELRLVLGALARVGASNEDAASAAFARAYRPFALGEAVVPAPDTAQLAAVARALTELAALSPLLKKNVISACADCVIHDGQVSLAESELLQAIALTLDCPLPPLLGGA